jgi:elongation factor 1-beta
MGEVLLKYRVMPDGTEVDLEQLQKNMAAALPAFAQIQRCEAKPFAFGLKALETTIVVADEEGNNDKVEDVLRAVPEVQGVELMEMGRL